MKVKNKLNGISFGLITLLGLGLLTLEISSLEGCHSEVKPSSIVEKQTLQTPRFDRIMTIVLENTSYSKTMDVPYFQSLSQKGRLYTNYHALTHPSYPNYLSMVSGQLLNNRSNTQHTFDDKSVMDLFEEKGLSWKAYAEGYPGNCSLVDHSGQYVRRHVPFLSFKSIQDSAVRCNRIVDASNFMNDWNSRTLASYSFYVPDLRNDGHDTGVAFAGQWLQGFLDPLLNDQAGMQGTLIVIVFDEDDGSESNRVFTLLISPTLQAGTVDSSPYTHYDMLRMVEDNFKLGNLGKEDASATGMLQFP